MTTVITSHLLPLFRHAPGRFWRAYMPVNISFMTNAQKRRRCWTESRLNQSWPMFVCYSRAARSQTLRTASDHLALALEKEWQLWHEAVSCSLWFDLCRSSVGDLALIHKWFKNLHIYLPSFVATHLGSYYAHMTLNQKHFTIHHADSKWFGLS